MSDLSVIVPCFDIAAHAGQMLHSLHRNAAPGIEFVLVDDGSTDETLAILTEGAERLPRARVVALPTNRGLAAARNAGLEAATGRYLTFLDGADLVAPGYYTELLEAIRALRCDFVRTDHVRVRGHQRSVHRVAFGSRGVAVPPRNGIGPAGRESAVDAPSVWAGVNDRRLLEDGLLQFDESLRTGEDRPWAWRLHLEARSFAVVGLLGVHRREEGSPSSRIADERQLDFIAAHEKVIRRTRADADADRLVPKAVRSLCVTACEQLSQRKRYTRRLASTMHRRLADAVGRLPEPDYVDVVAGLDPARAGTIRQLRACA